MKHVSIKQCNSMLKKCRNNGKYWDGTMLFNGIDNELKNNVTYSLGIELYSKLKDIHSCKNVFDSVEDKNSYLCNIMMNAYNENKMYDQTIELFSSKDVLNWRDNVSYNTVMKAYLKLNDINNAENIFDEMMNKDTFSYNTMLKGYNDHEMYHKMVELFETLEVQGIKDNYTCNIAMQGYSKLNDIENCEKIFSEMDDKSEVIYGSMMQSYNDNEMYHKAVELFEYYGKYTNNIISNIAIQAYSNMNDIHGCERIFRNNSNKNVIVWNSMMKAYNHNNMYHKTIELFLSKEIRKCKDRVSFNIVIESYSKLGDIYHCEKIFNSIHCKDVVNYGCMMQACNDNSMYHKSIELFKSKGMVNFKDTINCNIAIQAYSQLNDIPNCERIFNDIHNKTESTYGIMMQAYGDSKMYHKAIDLYLSNDITTYKSNTCHNIAIQIYSRLNDIDNCNKVFNSIPNKNQDSYGSIMQAYNDNAMFQETVQLYLSPEMNRFKYNAIISNIVIDAYSKLHRIDKCEEVFRNIKYKNMISYTVIMNACRLNDHHESLLAVFDELYESEKELPSQIFCNALHSCAIMILWEKGQKIIHTLSNKYNRHLVGDAHILSGILSLHAACNQDLNETRKLYNIMIKSRYIYNDNIILHASMLNCYTKYTDIDNVLKLYNELKQNEEHISDEIYSIILNCCAHTGNTYDAIQIFNEYLSNNNNIIEDIYILAPIIDCFARNNQLNDAEYYYNKYSDNITNYNDKIILLNSILSASKIHNDIDRAQRITKIMEDIININT